jgi:hypothetical protein
MTVVLELFDKQLPPPLATAAGERGRGEGAQVSSTAFTEDDRRLVSAAAEFGAEMIKQALGERQMQGMLVDAVAAALKSSQSVAATLAPVAERRGQAPPLAAPPPAPVLEQLRQSLEQFALGQVDPDQALKLAELLRVISLRHGRQAVQYCIGLLEGVDQLLRTATGETA